ncbi:MAG TPA: hypothetical protein VEW91_00110, partial [bacterium]|nr:hypothetical protein [bacterium]
MTGPALVRSLAGAAVLVLVGAQGGLSAPVPVVPPAAVLRMALDAPRVFDYEGTKIITVLRGGRTETITVAESHKRPDAVRLEYLSPEALAGRLIVDNGTITWHYEPRLNMAFEGPTLGGEFQGRDLTVLLRNYRVTALGVE